MSRRRQQTPPGHSAPAWLLPPGGGQESGALARGGTTPGPASICTWPLSLCPKDLSLGSGPLSSGCCHLEAPSPNKVSGGHLLVATVQSTAVHSLALRASRPPPSPCNMHRPHIPQASPLSPKASRNYRQLRESQPHLSHHHPGGDSGRRPLPPCPGHRETRRLLPNCADGQAWDRRGRPQREGLGWRRGPPARPQTQARHPAPPLQAGRLFDHGGTVFFSLFVALWAVLLLEYWKRKSATLAYRWGCSDYEDIEVGRPPRPWPPPARPPLSTGSLPGEATAPVCRLGPHHSPEPHHW